MGGWSGRTRGRLVMLFWFFAILYGLLVVRLVKVQWLDHERYAAMARAQQEGVAELPALRGEIRDRNNIVLATSLARYSVAVNPSQVRNRDKTAAALAELTGVDRERLDTVLARPITFSWVARKVPDQVAQTVKQQKMPGVFLLKEPTPGRRFYPKGHLAAHLLGATGVDDQGLDGLEAAYDAHLSGEPGQLRAYMDRDGYATLDAGALVRPAEAGNNVVLTLDETIQYVAERELAKVVKEYHAAGAICVVLDARTGAVLAMAIQPDFPAERFADVPAKLRRNRAITDPYEPGSTFKVFLAGAALNSGIPPTATYQAGGVLSVGGWTIHNAMDGLYAGNAETVTDIITYSFNVGTASIALDLGKDKFYKHLVAFGFGSQTGVDLIGEEPGLLANGKDWADINTATISFGQGVAVTPLQLASGMQAVANGGVRMKPHVVKAVLDSEGNVVERFAPKEIGRPLGAKSAAQLRDILINVCEKGTGKRARIPGFKVAGKTGTAQMAENGAYSGGRYIASFVGFAPADDPRIVVLVKVEEPNPYWGGVVAAPVFSSVAREALWKLGVRPNQPIDEDEADAE